MKKSRRRISGSRKSVKRKAERAKPTPTPNEISALVNVCVVSGKFPKRQFVNAGVRGDRKEELDVLKITAAAILQRVTK